MRAIAADRRWLRSGRRRRIEYLIWPGPNRLHPIGSNPPLVEAGELPELASRFDRVDPGILPPSRFIAYPMHEPVMNATERDRELVAGLAAERRRLHLPQMMRIGRLAAADQARLLATNRR